MPWNGSGVFARVYSWVADANAGLDILADRMDQDTDDIAQGLMHCLTVNGETVPTANLPMNNYRHTGVSAGVADTDYCTVGQLKNGGGGLPPGGYLPLSGGTMTGRLIMQSGNNPNITLNNTGGAPIWAMWAGGIPANLLFGTATAAGQPQTTLMYLEQSGNLVTMGNISCDVLTANSSRINVAGGSAPGFSCINTSGSGGDFGMWSASDFLQWGTVSAAGVPMTTTLRLDPSNGNFTLWGHLFAANPPLVIESATQVPALTVTGNATVGGALTGSGGATISGQVTAGTLITTAGGARFANTIWPAADNFAECGISTNAWYGVEAYAFVQHSDRRSKTDLAPLDADCLDLVRRIAPQRFRWAQGRDGRRDKGQHWGFVAQDVAAAMAAAGHEFGGHFADPESGAERLAYNELVAVLWRAVAQLTQRFDAMSTPATDPPAGLPA